MSTEPATFQATQESNPRRAVLRTFVQTVIPALLILALGVPEVIKIILAELGEVMPESVRLWMLAAAGVTAGIASALAKIMALPMVNDWLRGKRALSGLAAAPDRVTITVDNAGDGVELARIVDGALIAPDIAYAFTPDDPDPAEVDVVLEEPFIDGEEPVTRE